MEFDKPCLCFGDLLRESVDQCQERFVVLVLAGVDLLPLCEHLMHLVVKLIDRLVLETLELVLDDIDRQEIWVLFLLFLFFFFFFFFFCLFALLT